ncbi:MAG: prephenate dehydratase [Candidatus Woesearchaeota archaeon]
MNDNQKSNIHIMYQGIKGSYSSQALDKLSQKYSITHTPVENPHFFKELFESISEDTIALIPVENSIAGNVNQNNELFIRYDIQIIAEVTLNIHHCLFVSKEHFTKLKSDISKYLNFTILSHPQALAQCSDFITQYNFKVQEYNDTAGSLKYITEHSNELLLSIAPKFAQQFYSGKLLEENIENMKGNTTRFLLVKERGTLYAFEQSLPLKNKSTFLIELRDSIGSLYQITKILNEYNVNIKRIISKPHPSKHFIYIFLFDVEINLEDTRNVHILTKLQKEANYFKLLGSYPSWEEEN